MNTPVRRLLMPEPEVYLLKNVQDGEGNTLEYEDCVIIAATFPVTSEQMQHREWGYDVSELYPDLKNMFQATLEARATIRVWDYKERTVDFERRYPTRLDLLEHPNPEIPKNAEFGFAVTVALPLPIGLVDDSTYDVVSAIISELVEAAAMGLRQAQVAWMKALWE